MFIACTPRRQKQIGPKKSRINHHASDVINNRAIDRACFPIRVSGLLALNLAKLALTPRLFYADILLLRTSACLDADVCWTSPKKSVPAKTLRNSQLVRTNLSCNCLTHTVNAESSAATGSTNINLHPHIFKATEMHTIYQTTVNTEWSLTVARCPWLTPSL